MDRIKVLSECLHKIVLKIPEVRVIYLFGSQLEGNTGPMSDYDLGVVLDHGTEARQIQAHLAHVIASAMQANRVDVVLLHSAPIELAYHVIANGKMLYRRDLDTLVEFEAHVLGRYGDYLPTLRAHRDQVLQGGEYDIRVQRYRAALGRTERTLSQIRAVGR